MRIGTETFTRLTDKFYFTFYLNLLFFRKTDSEFLSQFGDNLIVQLSTVALFKHRKRRLFTTYLPGKHALGNAARSPCIFYLYADFWIQVCHRCVLWTLFYQ